MTSSLVWFCLHQFMFLEIQSAQDVILQLGGSRDTTTWHTFTILHIDRTCTYIFITHVSISSVRCLHVHTFFRHIYLIDISQAKYSKRWSFRVVSHVQTTVNRHFTVTDGNVQHQNDIRSSECILESFYFLVENFAFSTLLFLNVKGNAVAYLFY